MTEALCAAPLPEPLSLDAALALAVDTHPTVARHQAELELAEANALGIAAGDDVNMGVMLEARAIEPSNIARDQSSNDSRAILFARKRLYDFGRTQAFQEAAYAEVTSTRYRYIMEIQQHKLRIMQLFFDVILADLQHTRDNEAMAVTFVKADRARHQNELGQVSDIEKLEQEDRYQAARLQRYRSQAHQRSTRAILAQALNRPNELSSDLIMPELEGNNQQLPEVEQLVELALQHNPQVLSIKQQLEAARLQIKANRAGNRPILSGSLSASANNRDVGSRNPLEAELTLEIPLYQGDRLQADVAQAQARMRTVEAELLQFDYELRQQILEIWLEIRTLLAQRERVEVFTDFRELDFDQAQARYELELETDFGETLVSQSEAALLRAQTEFGLAINWAKLAALTSQPYAPIIDSDPATTSAVEIEHETTAQ